MQATELKQRFPWARVHTLEYPLRLDSLGGVLEEIRASHSQVHDESVSDDAPRLIGEHASMKELKRLMTQVAPSMATVLINGESGTGKEVVARQIHELSGRSGPFVAINCGAIPENLLESELFGHERGAFTGACKAHAGRFEQANGGTLFLDEIGDMPMIMQVKLLRVLEERVVERIGGGRQISVDVRVIAATHRHLPSRIAEGDFREDLYYRLSVFPLDVSPLRKHRDDIPLLTDEFVQRCGTSTALRISDAAMQKLVEYDWPGNVRELANVIERLVVTRPNGMVDEDDLPWPIAEQHGEKNIEIIGDSLQSGGALPLPDGVNLRTHLQAIERQMIESALTAANGVVQHAADQLGIGRTTLVEKIRRFEISV